MLITFPTNVQDDVIAMTVGSDVYKMTKGNILNKDFFVECFKSIPFSTDMPRACEELIGWNILTPKENERTKGKRKDWRVFSKNDTLFGAGIYHYEELENYTGKYECYDISTAIIPSMRGQGLFKYMEYLTDYLGMNGGNNLTKVSFSVIDSSNPTLKQQVKRHATYVAEEKDRFTERSHRFETNTTVIADYWKEKGITADMFTWTRMTSPLTDEKWQIPLVKDHLRSGLAWNDASRFS